MLAAHSMEEAEVLCDRLGIFVDGSFQCIGNPKEVRNAILRLYYFWQETDLTTESCIADL